MYFKTIGVKKKRWKKAYFCGFRAAEFHGMLLRANNKHCGGSVKWNTVGVSKAKYIKTSFVTILGKYVQRRKFAIDSKINLYFLASWFFTCFYVLLFVTCWHVMLWNKPVNRARWLGSRNFLQQRALEALYYIIV